MKQVQQLICLNLWDHKKDKDKISDEQVFEIATNSGAKDFI